MPAVRRDGDPQFSVPGFLAVKRDADGFVALENAAIVAIGAAPQGLQFAHGLLGIPIFRVAEADIVELLGEVDDGHGVASSITFPCSASKCIRARRSVLSTESSPRSILTERCRRSVIRSAISLLLFSKTSPLAATYCSRAVRARSARASFSAGSGWFS